ncbi:hypothetical protein [Halodesulfovibrio sp.]|jgi:hypothetical protein|nr:hypothetical protein [Halodesulfovibrio sp.]MCT4533956.1 hypothetical protein [Halodesulfovibrio sp.]
MEYPYTEVSVGWKKYDRRSFLILFHDGSSPKITGGDYRTEVP